MHYIKSIKIFFFVFWLHFCNLMDNTTCILTYVFTVLGFIILKRVLYMFTQIFYDFTGKIMVNMYLPKYIILYVSSKRRVYIFCTQMCYILGKFF